jgi:hypothetical protein
LQDNGGCKVRTLGPVKEEHGGAPALRYLDTGAIGSMSDPSLTRNGQSVVLRVDYGKARILMTGDLNFKSQALLLQSVPNEEFRCDVAEACHHGSDDVWWKFAEAMEPIATMFSSGDNEGHAHPRAKALAMTTKYGRNILERRRTYDGFSEKKYFGPLTYSTGLSRSTQIYKEGRALEQDGTPARAGKLEAEGRGDGDGPIKNVTDG